MKRARSPSGEDFWKLQLEAIYARRNPMKVEKIPELLEKYRGREAVLYKMVCQRYDLNPQKFHSDPDAWAEYDRSEHHGHLAGSEQVSSAPAEAFEVNVSTLSGASCKIQVQRDVLVRVLLRHACEALEMQPWCSRLCFKNERLDNDQRAGNVGMVAGSELTLISLPDPILQEAVESFMQAAEEQADGVYVVVETSSVPLRSCVLDVFRCSKAARACALEAASTAYHAARDREDDHWENGDEIEGPSLRAGEDYLQLVDERSTRRWHVAVKLVK